MKKTSAIEMHRLSVEQFRQSEKLPLIVVLDDVRSLYNVGSIFRTSDAFRIEALYLCGITATPDVVMSDNGTTIVRDCSLKASQEIHKTALGAEESVSWRYFKDPCEAVKQLKSDGYTVLAMEQCHGSTMLQDFIPSTLTPPSSPLSPSATVPDGSPSGSPLLPPPSPGMAIILGNEVKGVRQDVVDMCDDCLEIPQFGTKHSLNVAVTAGIAIWHISNILRMSRSEQKPTHPSWRSDDIYLT